MARALLPAAPPLRFHPRPRFLNPAAPASLHPVELRSRLPRASSSTADAAEEAEVAAMTVDALHRFIDLNIGKWNGSLYQFDAEGNTLQTVSTRLSASSYGEDELISLLQTLYIKQASSRIFTSDNDVEAEWVEYKIKETNMFTVDKYQQIGFFADEKAFSLRYQTIGMLEYVLRAGVLGEDDIGEESPKNLKIPSRRPSVVCENCLYTVDGNSRARAFLVMDPKGIFDTLLVFLEERGQESLSAFSADAKLGSLGVVTPFLGRWEGHSITKRSGLYGATLAEADTVALLEMDDKGRIIQDIITVKSGTDTRSNVHWQGVRNNNLLHFDGGFQMTLLPGGMYVGYPSDIGKIVSETQSFHLEFCWMESPERRQRLVRTYDPQGMVVSSTYFREFKV